VGGGSRMRGGFSKIGGQRWCAGWGRVSGRPMVPKTGSDETGSDVIVFPGKRNSRNWIGKREFPFWTCLGKPNLR
jgi:hypothetical protein